MSKLVAAQEAFKLALSMSLMFLLALWMDWDMPGNGGLAIILVSLGTNGASFNKGAARILGTTAALFVGFAAVGWLGQSMWGTLAFFSVYMVFIGYMMQWSRMSYAWFVAGFVPVMIWSSAYGSGEMGTAAFHYGSFRYLETSTGIIIYTTVSAVLWPKRAGGQLPALGAVVWESARKLLEAYRSVLSRGDADDKAGAGELRAKLAGGLAKINATLVAAYGDTPAVRKKKKLWEVTRVNLRGLIDALELWGESCSDCLGMDLGKCLPDMDACLDRLHARLERIGRLWGGDTTAEGEDLDLLGVMELKLSTDAVASLSHAELARLQGLVLQSQLLDRCSVELLKGQRVLGGLEKKDLPEPVVADLHRRVAWDPQRLIKALFPPLTFVVSFLAWIQFDLPGGASVPSTTAAIALNYVNGRMNAMGMLKILCIGLFVFVAPIYFWVMPLLDTGTALIALIFIFTFVFAYLGASKPLLRMIPILMFVNMTGISNQQSYSFMAIMGAALMLLVCLSSIAVVDMLWAPTRPELMFSGTLKKFLKGSAAIVDAFPKGDGGGSSVRKRYFDSMIHQAPAEMQAAAKKLKLKEFPSCDPASVQLLVDGLEGVSMRLRAVEIAQRELGDEVPDLRKRLGGAGQELADLVSGRLRSMARLEEPDPPGNETNDLKRISAVIEQELESGMAKTVPVAFYALLGSLRGLILAIEETGKTMRHFDWQHLARPRF